MAKKKDSTALFEVLSRTREDRRQAGLSVPAWMGKGPKQAPPPAEEQPEAPPAKVSPTRTEPIISTAGGRLKLSLNQTSCIVLIVGMVVLLALMFLLGRLSVGDTESGPTGSGDDAAAGLTKGESKTINGSRRIAAQRVAGKWYPVIQGLQGYSDQHRAEAEKIIEYCNKNNEPATLATFTDSRGRKQYIVWSLVPFDSADDYRAKEHAEAIEALGASYPGRYNFKHERNEFGQIVPWMLQYTGQ